MSVSYDALWRRMKVLGLTKKDLMAATHLSPATMAKLAHNKTVSMDAIVTICSVLKCDIGDIVHISTQEQVVDQVISEYVKNINDPAIVKYAVERYFDEKGISKNEFVKKVGISANTLTRVLNQEPCNLSTYKKLFAVLSLEIISTVDNMTQSQPNGGNQQE
jgi:DNA-binding Xre family transcriptional regulator